MQNVQVHRKLTEYKTVQNELFHKKYNKYELYKNEHLQKLETCGKMQIFHTLYMSCG